MRRTEWLQEIRITRFEEAFFGWTESRLTQDEAARVLGVCTRTFRRWSDWYEEEGLEGLRDKRLPQASKQGRRWMRSWRSIHNRTDYVLQNRIVLFAINKKNY
ncbi:MAG: helix-turn-helix domain-containing protein [Candidatus Poribacteria bacterium]|nr:helix-turn-helix domain-containing protein [Candidatus Poribacteria bacterium]